MSVQEDTQQFEDWLRTKCDVFEPALRCKHQQMFEAYPFFRATYYRWARHWRELAGPLADAPPVLAIGDIHLENYGTWRDSDARLCWGINDFDEADDLPWTHDLVRLAASTQFAVKAGLRSLPLGEACRTILAGYRQCLRSVNGEPFVLEEHHSHLRKLALRSDQEPEDYWKEKLSETDGRHFAISADARKTLLHAMPDESLEVLLRQRMYAGVGSLGKPRFVAFADWHNGLICREAKALTPPATAWLDGSSRGSRLPDAIAVAVRSPDPFYDPIGHWITRRLAPHCSRIELKDMKAVRVMRMLAAMGAEIANVHLGTAGAAKAILDDLKHRPRNWLESTAAAMAEAIRRDWKRWRRDPLN